MTNPVYKIEVWEPGGGSALHTITKDAISIYYKDVVTSSVGTFNIVLPSKKNGNTYYYNDIDEYDTVKIWLGYDSVSGNPDFVGKVYSPTGHLSPERGYLRQISGLSESEILLRRLKTNKFWLNIDASVIVTELANDLSLGTGEIAADTTDIYIDNLEAKNYLDFLQFISDYWYNAGTQVKKDFYVDISDNLVWKARPIRTAGVETFTLGKNIISYTAVPNLLAVKNKIFVYGDYGGYVPNDENWTESLTNWTSTKGTLSLESGVVHDGTYSIKCAAESSNGAPYETDFSRTFQSDLNHISGNPKLFLHSAEYLRYWAISNPNAITISVVNLEAPDGSNYFYQNEPIGTSWSLHSLELGPNASPAWTESGSPDWDHLTKVHFYTYDTSDHYVCIDNLAFDDYPYYKIVQDATSISNYGQRDLQVHDRMLQSIAECEKRGETLLYQQKDPPTQITLTTPGNTNVFVGDRLSMTLAPENISAENFDVICVEQSLNKVQGFRTQVTMVNSINIREVAEVDTLKALLNTRRQIRQLARNEKLI